MTRYSVNFNMDFGIDVSQKEIDKKRKWLQAMHDDPECANSDYIWDLEITVDSTDEEIAKFIGIENYRSAEGVELDIEGVETYDEKREKELEIKDEEDKKRFRELNPHLFDNINKKDAEMIIDLIRINVATDKFIHTDYYNGLVEKLRKHFGVKEKKK